jgi:hypothetical protein
MTPVDGIESAAEQADPHLVLIQPFPRPINKTVAGRTDHLAS